MALRAAASRRPLALEPRPRFEFAQAVRRALQAHVDEPEIDPRFRILGCETDRLLECVECTLRIVCVVGSDAALEGRAELIGPGCLDCRGWRRATEPRVVRARKRLVPPDSVCPRPVYAWRPQEDEAARHNGGKYCPGYHVSKKGARTVHRKPIPPKKTRLA